MSHTNFAPRSVYDEVCHHTTGMANLSTLLTFDPTLKARTNALGRIYAANSTESAIAIAERDFKLAFIRAHEKFNDSFVKSLPEGSQPRLYDSARVADNLLGDIRRQAKGYAAFAARS